MTRTTTPTAPTTGARRTRTAVGGGAAAAAALALTGFAGCSDDTVVEDAEEQGEVAQDIIMGETVTMQNEVSEILGDNTMAIGADDTLVLAADTSEFSEGELVQVTGTVRTLYTPDVLETDFDLDDEQDVLVDYENELVVVADEVVDVPTLD
ncbi:hypothetical protein [Aquipuribacter nitratireducens]|uniref:DUF5666 domain-containing protein n=1 Tax=Aquipuribacter nitratireducens TaxID=650104 RepID=A0ABW0GJS8_9MICO